MYNGAQIYKKMDVMTTDPRRLILMLYEGALKHLFKAREGIQKGDVQVKCESISKAIAIISELLSSVVSDENNEAAIFLRGLYSAILAELPKANLEDDILIVERSIKYIAQLKNIWESHVMTEPAQAKLGGVKDGVKTTDYEDEEVPSPDNSGADNKTTVSVPQPNIYPSYSATVVSAMSFNGKI